MTSVTMTPRTRTANGERRTANSEQLRFRTGKLKPICFTMFLILFSIKGYSQWTFDGDVNTQAYVSLQTNQPYLDLVADFGANPNDELDDTWAFIKAAWFLGNKQIGLPMKTSRRKLTLKTKIAFTGI